MKQAHVEAQIGDLTICFRIDASLHRSPRDTAGSIAAFLDELLGQGTTKIIETGTKRGAYGVYYARFSHERFFISAAWSAG